MSERMTDHITRCWRTLDPPRDPRRRRSVWRAVLTCPATWLVITFLAVVVATLAGCQAPAPVAQGGDLTAGSTTTTTTETLDPESGAVLARETVTEERHATAQQPENPADGASAQVTSQGAAAGLVGGAIVPDHTQAQTAAILTWTGAGLIFLGAILWWASKSSIIGFIPLLGKLSWTACAGTIGAGVLMIGLAQVLDELGTLTIVLLVLGVLVVVGYLAYHGLTGLNWYKAKATEAEAAPPTGEPPP